MINRSIHMIFESSGMPVPSAEEVQYEAREIVKRSGWGLPLIDRLHKVADPYWREAIARCLLEKWNELGKTKYKDKKDEEIVAVMCTCFVEH